jgi:hypothetical protein
MNAYPYMQPSPDVTRAKDEGDLNLLSILHYVWSALLGCSTLGIAGYFGIVAAFIEQAPSHGARGAHDQQVAAGVMIVMGIVMAVLMIPLVVLHILAAAGLKKRTRYLLVFIMACWTCLSFPLGTGLGIWTIIVLNRPSVKALFGRA